MTFELFKKLSPPSVFHVEHAVSKKVPDLSRWAAKLSLPECDAVIICGAGKGLYPFFKGKKIAIVEPDPGLLKGYLETDEAKWLLEDPNGLLVGGEPAALQLLSWSFAESQVQIASAPERGLEEFAEKVLYGCAEAKQVLHEYFQGGAVFYRSYYRNLEILPEALDGAKLFGAFAGVPRVICGAGPSVKKNVHLLQGLREKAVIFSGGSALNALFAEGVEPHFGVGVDPNPTQYYRMMGHGARGVPFFFRPRMHFEALAAVYGPKLFLRGAGGYPTAEWF
ncbi:MAG: DUF115 domain-containing protein, partial [Chlamydiia bacterium]|nr:DUF115 domain-containing protein [Chlamydiia bacterium]